jgi:hypothetical protein
LSSSRAGAVIHRNVAVIACDTPGTLKETMVRLAELDLDAVCFGDRHLLLPAARVPLVLEALKQHGQFPRLIGELSAHVADDAAAEALDEEEDG